ncbi:MAG: MBOAT family protein [Lachnospiraceae bacterium]|nr:MBOAT family protein [Lachnospiraceae bacterium]
MVFSSVIFLWVLLPVILGCYYLSPRPFRNGLLMVFSLFFYAWGEPTYILLMVVSVLLNYVFGILLETVGKKKSLLALCVALNLLILGYFKYSGFLVETLNHFLAGSGRELPAVEAALPIGISFYTFQALSYVVDVYRGENKAQRNLVNMMLYISFFPQLIAGPIVKYHDIERQIENRTVTVDGFSYGVKRFIFGLGKKVILANSFAEVVDAVRGYPAGTVSAPLLWLTALLYMLQIYFDFSGYSDMAIGLGRMFGFTFNENFLLPYTAVSVRDFWRKWHISLSGWFREYVYIPLGGSRKGTVRTYRNLGIVFLLTGIWHGAGWTFLFWGLYHGFFLILERALTELGTGNGRQPQSVKERSDCGQPGHLVRWLSAHLYTLLVVYFGWIFFRADTIGAAVEFIRNMFLPHAAVITMERFLDRKLLFLLLTGLGACGPVQWLWKKWKGCGFAADGEISLPAMAGYLLVLWGSLLLLVNNTYNPFIYFRF